MISLEKQVIQVPVYVQRAVFDRATIDKVWPSMTMKNGLDQICVALGHLEANGVDIGSLLMLSSVGIMESLVKAVCSNYADPEIKYEKCMSHGVVPLYGYDMPFRMSNEIDAYHGMGAWKGLICFLPISVLLKAVDETQIIAI